MSNGTRAVEEWEEMDDSDFLRSLSGRLTIATDIDCQRYVMRRLDEISRIDVLGRTHSGDRPADDMP